MVAGHSSIKRIVHRIGEECRSTAEIARRLGLTESAVNTRLSRGRALLRKIFEEEGIEP